MKINHSVTLSLCHFVILSGFRVFEIGRRSKQQRPSMFVLLVFSGTCTRSNQPQFAKEPTIHRGVDGQRCHLAV